MLSDSELIRSASTIDKNIKRWLEEYVTDEEMKEKLWKMACELGSAYNRALSAALSAPLYPTKPVSSKSAAVAGSLLGGTALGVASYLEAEKKNEKYWEDFHAASVGAYNSEEAMKELRKKHTEIMKVLQTIPGWVEEQERIKKEQAEAALALKKEKRIFFLTRIAISLVISAIVYFFVIKRFHIATDLTMNIFCICFFSFFPFCIIMMITCMVDQPRMNRYFQKKRK